MPAPSTCMCARLAAPPRKGNEPTAVGTSQLKFCTGLLGGRSSFWLGVGIWISVSSMCQGNQMQLAVAGNCMLLKNISFFSYSYINLPHPPSPQGPSGATLAPPCPHMRFLLEEGFPIPALAAHGERRYMALKTPSSHHAHLGRRAGSHLHRRECAESRSPRGMTTGFVPLLR